MFKGAFIFVCGIAAGVLVMDTTIERATVKMPRWTMEKPQAEPLRLTHPVQCDATVDGKCYIRGMK